jgi:hypothetical protein
MAKMKQIYERVAEMFIRGSEKADILDYIKRSFKTTDMQFVEAQYEGALEIWKNSHISRKKPQNS